MNFDNLELKPLYWRITGAGKYEAITKILHIRYDMRIMLYKQTAGFVVYFQGEKPIGKRPTTLEGAKLAAQKDYEKRIKRLLFRRKEQA